MIPIVANKTIHPALLFIYLSKLHLGHIPLSDLSWCSEISIPHFLQLGIISHIFV